MSDPMFGVTCSAITRHCSVNIAVLDSDFNPDTGTLVTFSPRLWATDRPIPTFYYGTCKYLHFVLPLF